MTKKNGFGKLISAHMFLLACASLCMAGEINWADYARSEVPTNLKSRVVGLLQSRGGHLGGDSQPQSPFAWIVEQIRTSSTAGVEMASVMMEIVRDSYDVEYTEDGRIKDVPELAAAKAEMEALSRIMAQDPDRNHPLEETAKARARNVALKAYDEQQRPRQSLWNAAKGAIRVFGESRYKAASGVVAETAMHSPSAMFRYLAIESLVKIGDTNMIDVARWVVVNDPDHRAVVYREVAAYLAKSENGEDGPIQLLADSVAAETNVLYARRIDETLCVSANAGWKDSHERQAVLERFPADGYCKAQIEDLVKLPPSERTHVEVHPLRGPAPDLAVTNGPLAPAVEAILKETPSPAPPSAVTNAP